jgi:hypothetical protein
VSRRQLGNRSGATWAVVSAVALLLLSASWTRADSGRDIFAATAKLREYRAGVWRPSLDGPAGMERCASRYFQTVFDQRHLLSPNDRSDMSLAFQRPYNPGDGPWPTERPLDKILLTPNFKFWYVTEGRDAPPMEDVAPANGVPDYMDIMADAFERSYDFEVGQMGFKKPLSDYWVPNNGGDERIDVFCFAAPFLGVTVAQWFERVLPTAVTGTPWFGMNTRMYEFFGKEEGKRYIETTVAHEFLHGCQQAYNARLPAWVAESSATWMETRMYDGGRVDDGDAYDDVDYPGETDGVDQVYQQLRQWFAHPDKALSAGGGHAYGNVVLINYLTERFGVDFVRELYEEFTEGGSREYGNFWDLLATKGTNWAETFKTFTIWNYFTGERAAMFDGYRDAARYPPIGIHPQDRNNVYPTQRVYDERVIPAAMSSRYVVFEAPPGGIAGPFSIKIKGATVQELIDAGGLLDFENGEPSASFYRQWLEIVGLRGWAAPLIIEKRNGEIVLDEIFTFSLSQEGQKDFEGFGSDIKRITMIVTNIRPDADEPGNYISYSAGAKPQGRLENLRAAALETGGVQLTWDLVDLTDTREVYVIRKRFSPVNGDSDQDNFSDMADVLHAGDRDGNHIPDSPVQIMARLSATDTQFVDTTTFDDVLTTHPSFDPTQVKYFYAVVPVSGTGLMGTPALAPEGVTPVPAAAPAFMIATHEPTVGRWEIGIRATRQLNGPPNVAMGMPNGGQVQLALQKAGAQEWTTRYDHPTFPKAGTYSYSVTGRTLEGVEGKWILSGGAFRYAPSAVKPHVIITPNRVHRIGDGPLSFYPPGMDISIYDVTGRFVNKVQIDAKWDCTNSYGEKVTPGMYMFVAQDDNGFRETGRLVLK